MPGVEEGCGRGVGTEGGDGGLDEVKVQSVHWPSGQVAKWPNGS